MGRVNAQGAMGAPADGGLGGKRMLKDISKRMLLQLLCTLHMPEQLFLSSAANLKALPVPDAMIARPGPIWRYRAPKPCIGQGIRVYIWGSRH